MKSEHVENPFGFGMLHGVLLGVPVTGAFASDVESAEMDGVPGVLYEATCRYSAWIYSIAKFIGCILSVVNGWIVWGLIGTRRATAMAVMLMMFGMNMGCASVLPKSSWNAAVDNRSYEGQVKGYSASKYYDFPVGYYVAEVKHYSDVAEIPSSRETVYGSLSVRRPLLNDNTVFVKDSGVYSEDSWFRQGTVFVVAQQGGAFHGPNGEEKTSKEKPTSKLSENPKAQPAAKVSETSGGQASKDKPLSERIRPVVDKKSEQNFRVAGRSKETVLMSMPLSKVEDLSILGEALKQINLRGNEMGRVIGHLEPNSGQEQLLANIAKKLRDMGVVEVEIYNVGKFGVEGETAPEVEVMVIRRVVGEDTKSPKKADRK